MLRLRTAILIISISAFSAGAAEIFVNPLTGSDGNSGGSDAPLKNIQTAIARAKPGDTVKLESLDKAISGLISINEKKGTPAQPITIDGNFNTLLGTRRITVATAEKLSDNLYHVKKKKISPNFLWRFFMVFDGKVERMGQHSKDKCAQFKKPEELAPLEWTIIDGTDLYFKLPPNATIESISVEEPVLLNGVQITGKSEHIIVKNIIVKNFWNDGFNIHDNSKNIIFDTVAAIYCGDDGISAHDGCILSIRNMVSIGNGTGVCHAGSAEAIHENMYIEGADSRDIFMLNIKNSFDKLTICSHAMATSEFGDKGVNTINNAIIYSDNPARLMRTRNAKSVTGTDNKIVNYNFDGVFPGLSSPPPSVDDVKQESAAAKTEILKRFMGKLQ